MHCLAGFRCGLAGFRLTERRYIEDGDIRVRFQQVQRQTGLVGGPGDAAFARGTLLLCAGVIACALAYPCGGVRRALRFERSNKTRRRSARVTHEKAASSAWEVLVKRGAVEMADGGTGLHVLAEEVQRVVEALPVHHDTIGHLSPPPRPGVDDV